MTDIIRADVLRPGELRGMCILLFVAGTETVVDFIGNALVALAEHPKQRSLLVRDPTLIPAAVEEMLRFESPVQHQVRTSTQPVALHGTGRDTGLPRHRPRRTSPDTQHPRHRPAPGHAKFAERG